MGANVTSHVLTHLTSISKHLVRVCADLRTRDSAANTIGRNLPV